MRKIVSLILSLMLLWVIAAPVQAADQIHVLLDGSELNFEVAPYVESGRTLIPVRALSEALGFQVDWNAAEQKITLTRDTDSITLWVDSTKVMINGKERQLDVPARIVSGRTFIPLRFVAENLGAYVAWDGTRQTAIIRSGKGLAALVASKQQAAADQKGTGEFFITMELAGAGIPGGKMLVKTSLNLALQTHQDEMLLSTTTKTGDGPEIKAMVAARNGKIYQQTTGAPGWIFGGNYDPKTPSSSAIFSGMFGADPLSLQQEALNKTLVRVVGTEDVDGVKLVHLELDMSKTDFTGMIQKIMASTPGATADTMKIQVDKYVVSFLVNPDTGFVSQLDMNIDVNVTTKTPAGDMAMHQVVAGSLKTAPTTEPIPFPADLPQ